MEECCELGRHSKVLSHETLYTAITLSIRLGHILAFSLIHLILYELLCNLEHNISVSQFFHLNYKDTSKSISKFSYMSLLRFYDSFYITIAVDGYRPIIQTAEFGVETSNSVLT